MENRIIPQEELSKFGSVQSINEQAKSLIEQQRLTWEVAAKNFGALATIQTKDFDFGHFKITAQFNTERIRSSAAETDAKSIAGRTCFLCLKNLQQKQKGILFQNKYLILTNPYPIFPKHLTISNREHIPQQILSHLSDMLQLSKNLPDFTVFYNGPKCGASAPDHFHFQSGSTNVMRVEKEFDELEKNHSQILLQTNDIKIVAIENYLRRFIAIVASKKELLEEKFKQIFDLLDIKNGEEPMMNVLCNYTKNQWRVIIFPREKQRPSHFFRDDEQKIVVGPASVEMGGILVLPREEDFKKITKKEIEEIYSEVSISKEKFSPVIKKISRLK
ncbi:DUF4922 domain-containing protein [Maribellus maritimus]|uniref:DUF4922 domain-containing protein n=1 Tax=Maribellus maritimus TaxID=2870838 RepID=UPI001EE9FCC0|nr:DUF4922 domain-containing protein [Maribellus maritimus]MCG6188967.1 DUF4922 domain-containing protein [Maribellus maritimus]